jgi:hypothetical protein
MMAWSQCWNLPEIMRSFYTAQIAACLLPTVVADGLTPRLLSSTGILSCNKSSINNTLYNSS